MTLYRMEESTSVKDNARSYSGIPPARIPSWLRNYLKSPQHVIPDSIRNLPDASNAIFVKILNQVQDDLPVLR